MFNSSLFFYFLVGIGWKIVDCTAHDGLGDSSQKLLDETGCPVDELLMPMPEAGPARDIDLMRHQEAVAKFAAFKFPDRDRLHLSCGLQLCRGACLKVMTLNNILNSKAISFDLICLIFDSFGTQF